MVLIKKLIGMFLPRFVANVGQNTKITGRIERRHPSASVRIGQDSLVSGVLVAEDANSRLTIGDRVFVGGNSLIDCVRQITIEDDVLLTARF